MSQFFKKFLSGEGTTGRSFALGAFGKHPGWDDHVEDLGLETESLVLAKRILYVQGVGGQIDTGAWEKLGAEQRLEGFSHIFLWQRGGQYLIGRMWSSSDGKGRTRYPMVICAHCMGVPLTWGLEKVLPRLNAVEQACKATNSADDVKSILDRARTELRGALPAAGEETDFSSLSPQTFSQFVTAPVLGPEQQGWFRVLYQIQNQMSAFNKGNFNARDAARTRAAHIRLPVVASTPDQALLLWRRFFSERIDRQVPTFFSLSPGNPWLDVILGEPSTQEFFCLRASSSGLPLATEVPYELDEKFKAQARQLLADFQSGKPISAAALGVSDDPPAPSGGWASLTQRFFKGRTKLWLLLIGGGLVAAAGSAWFLNQGRLSTPRGTDSEVANRTESAAGARLGSQEKAPTDASPPEPVAAKLDIPKAPKAIEEPVRRSEGNATITAQAPEPQPAVQQELVTQAQIKQPDSKVEPSRPQFTATPPVQETNEEPNPAALLTAAAAPPSETGVVSPKPAVARPAIAPGSAALIGKALTNSVGMVLLWVAALPGTSEGAWVGKYEVTQAEFEQVMSANPSQLKHPQLPVENLRWDEAIDFCRKLTTMETAILPEGWEYGLPTEQQWEFFLGNATFDDAITSRAARRESSEKVGNGSPSNEHGLVDVLGNVWEFCADSGASADRLLKGSAYNSRKVMDWKPLERNTPRRLATDARAADAGFRCILSSTK